MKILPLLLGLALLAACQAPGTPGASGAAAEPAAESARPEIRYYMIADT